MPFGLQTKSLIVGILLAWFVIPYFQALLSRRSAPAPAQ